MQHKLPIGIENFKRIRTEGYYYVDKTGLIRDLLQNMAYVNLFTRPRRFGKTLNMSMLKYFFEAGSDTTVYDGLEISKEKELCEVRIQRFGRCWNTIIFQTSMTLSENGTMVICLAI